MHEVPQKGDKIQYFEMYTVHLVISDLEKYCMYGSLNVLKKLLHRQHNIPNKKHREKRQGHYNYSLFTEFVVSVTYIHNENQL